MSTPYLSDSNLDNKNDEKQSKVQEMEIDTGADQVVFGIEERSNVSTR